MKKSVNIASSSFPPIISFIVLLLIWEFGVRLYHVPDYILAAPSQVIGAMIEKFPLLMFHTTATLLEAITGFILSVVLAFVIAFLLTSINWLNRAIYPLLIVSQTIPLIILAVLFTIWFGFGMIPKILVVIMVCFFPIVINLINGINSVDRDLVNLFRSMGAGCIATLTMVKLPSAMPSFFSGLRISATYSIMAAVIGEWLGAQRGLGYFMTLQQKSFAIDQVLAAVVIICLLSLLMVKAVDLLEYLLIPWNRKQNQLEYWEQNTNN